MTMHTSHKSKSKKTSVSSTIFDFKITKKRRTRVEKRVNERIMEEWVNMRSSRSEVKTQSDAAVLALAMDRASEVQANLSPEFPSFVKPMKCSNVVKGFWLILDKGFCDSHLPKRKSKVTLVDENEKEYVTTYLKLKNSNSFGLSAKWRGFARDNHLRVDDVVIFQLFEPRKLKVYIIRAETTTELDIAISLLNLNPHVETMEPMDTTDTDQNEASQETEREKYDKPLSQGSCNLKHTLLSNANHDPSLDEFDSYDDNDNSSTEVLDGLKFSQNDIHFGNVKRFEDFTIQVNGLKLDSRIPLDDRIKYYELCSSRKIFLHENLKKELDYDESIGIILETIEVADAIKEMEYGGKLVSDLKSWDRTLQSFEGKGMEVGFLRAKITKMLGYYFRRNLS